MRTSSVRRVGTVGPEVFAISALAHPVGFLEKTALRKAVFTGNFRGGWSGGLGVLHAGDDARTSALL